MATAGVPSRNCENPGGGECVGKAYPDKVQLIAVQFMNNDMLPSVQTHGAMTVAMLGNATCRAAIAGEAILPFRQAGTRQPDGSWLVPVSDDVREMLRQVRLAGETGDDAILRLPREKAELTASGTAAAGITPAAAVWARGRPRARHARRTGRVAGVVGKAWRKRRRVRGRRRTGPRLETHQRISDWIVAYNHRYPLGGEMPGKEYGQRLTTSRFGSHRTLHPKTLVALRAPRKN